MENQFHELREFCGRSRWIIEHEYIDRMTASTDKRPRFLRLFEDARRRRFDVVLFWSPLDRFSREGVLETLQRLRRLDTAGVAWRSYTESYFDSTGAIQGCGRGDHGLAG
jgi:DNA invertase Pin-like site-specific DNA recombinase